MKLSYNRLVHQGNKVVFPNGKTGIRFDTEPKNCMWA